MNKEKIEIGDNKEQCETPLKPEMEEVLKFVYEELDERERKEVEKKIIKDDNLRTIATGMVMAKSKYSFKTIDEHRTWLVDCRKKMNDYYNNELRNKVENIL